MVVRSKDIPQTPAQEVARRHRVAAKQAEDIRAQLAGKQWADLKAADKTQLLRAFALQFGFIDPD